MLTLPLYYEDEHLRVVHACWDADVIGRLRGRLVDDRLTPELLVASADKSTQLYADVEIALKGREMALPPGASFVDGGGHARAETRIRWWGDPAGHTYRSLSLEPLEALPDTPVDLARAAAGRGYGAGERPVFFGHYWLRGEPALLAPNVCCLDYSVARGGVLAGYRFGGEGELENGRLVWE